jgi:hypothetical protein
MDHKQTSWPTTTPTHEEFAVCVATVNGQNPRRLSLNVAAVKEAATGRELDLLVNVAGIPRDLLDGKRHPCPRCGGTDRFRLIDAPKGAVYCNQCFHSGCGDFLAAIKHYRGVSFRVAVDLAADHLNLLTNPPVTPQRTFPSADQLVWHQERCWGPVTLRHDYQNADGECVGVILRWDLADPVFADRLRLPSWRRWQAECIAADKELPRRKISQASQQNGVWVFRGMPSPRPLYRLPEVLIAEQVLVTEGEKTADEARQLLAMADFGSTSVAITTAPGGAQSPAKADWSVLAGKRVTIWPDHDEAGRRYCETIRGELSKCRPLPKLRVIDPAKLGLSEKDDVVDFVAMRRYGGQDDVETYREVRSWML